ncbi:hypothetical protein [Cytobacillus purgationiresistens]|uniref:RibD domain-containing protein n=1 Tax=Cytobacillus purgationiresistens TaxID=863449 RepID=A0ABU0AEC7_9BACI|nr:hypothetical protein [Cytobacillus purgationiresistens]MDQ0269604.1 hypothetical protein [Cytobacillus purgationiresistens]
MRQYKVICHMVTSLDGKIDGNYLETPSASYFGQEWENIHHKYNSNAWICGRVSFEENVTYGN